MRTVTYGAACSLDGFIADAACGLDWLHFSSDVQDVMAKYWPTVDTILMGRKTWDTSMGGPECNEPGVEQAAGSEAGGPVARNDETASAADVGKASPAGDTTCESGMPTDLRTYVFSRTLKQIEKPGVHLVSGDAGEFVRELKRKPGRGICVMGGGDFARSLLEAGVVDEVGLNVHPVLLGSGIPLFLDAGRRIRLSLAESRTIAGGCVLSTYRVTPEQGTP